MREGKSSEARVVLNCIDDLVPIVWGEFFVFLHAHPFDATMIFGTDSTIVSVRHHNGSCQQGAILNKALAEGTPKISFLRGGNKFLKPGTNFFNDILIFDCHMLAANLLLLGLVRTGVPPRAVIAAHRVQPALV